MSVFDASAHVTNLPLRFDIKVSWKLYFGYVTRRQDSTGDAFRAISACLPIYLIFYFVLFKQM